MAVDDFNIERIGTLPAETHSPLIVDPDAVLTAPSALEFLQPVRRRHSQIIQVLGTVQDVRLAQRHSLDAPWKPTQNTALPDDLCLSVRERTNHPIRRLADNVIVVYRQHRIETRSQLPLALVHPDTRMG